MLVHFAGRAKTAPGLALPASRHQGGAAIVKVTRGELPMLLTSRRGSVSTRGSGGVRARCLDAATRARIRTTRVKCATGRRIERIGECEAEPRVWHAKARLRRQH